MPECIAAPFIVAKVNRRNVLGLGLQGVGAAAMVGLTPRWAQAAITMRYADHAVMTHPVTIASEAMCKRIAERTNGELTITYFPNFALGSSPQQIDQLRRGTIEFAQDSPGPVSAFNKAIGMLNAPYVFDDYPHVWKFMDDVGRDWLTTEYAKGGFVYINAFEWGFRAMTTQSVPINSPADVKGLKMRTPPELELQAVYEALGAFPQAIVFGEVYMALASNVVDGQCNSLASIFEAKFFEVQKHLSYTKHQYTGSMLLAHPGNWNKLSAELQTIVREEADAAAVEARQAIVSKDEQYLTDLEAAGMTVVRPDVNLFREAMGPAYEKIKESRGDEAFNQVMDLAEKARKSL